LKSISVCWITLKVFQWGVIVVGSTLMFGSRLIMKEAKDCAKASMKAALLKGGALFPGK
jgi:hypothetical protein